MLQCLDHIILRLAHRDILRDQASHLIPTQDDFLTLVRFLLAHNGRYYFRCEFAFREELPHTDSLIVGRGALVQVDFINHRPLAVLVQIG